MRKVFRKTKSGQQLIEFLLVAPFFVIIFGILTEYAYALSVNMTLDFGLKKVTSEIYSQLSHDMTPADIDSTVQSNLSDYLKQNNVPVNGENNLNVHYVNIGNNTVFVAGYKYVVAFTLPKTFFYFLPDEFNFSSISLVPKAFINGNDYGGGSLNSVALDKIWSASADFSSLSGFADSEKGIMTNSVGTSNSDTDRIRIMIPEEVEDASLSSDSTYLIVPWQGTNTGKYVDVTNGHVYSCSGASCSSINSNYLSYFQGIGATNLIFYESFIPSTADEVPTVWATGSGPVSSTSVDGLLKMALALYDESNMNVGNYDNLDVSSYNASASMTKKYSMDSFGSMVIMHSAAVDLNVVAGSTAPQTVNYDFGGQVNKL